MQVHLRPMQRVYRDVSNFIFRICIYVPDFEIRTVSVHILECMFLSIFQQQPKWQFLTHCRPGSRTPITTWRCIRKNNSNNLFYRRPPLCVHRQIRSPPEELQRKIGKAFDRQGGPLPYGRLSTPRSKRHRVHRQNQQGRIERVHRKATCLLLLLSQFRKIRRSQHPLRSTYHTKTKSQFGFMTLLKRLQMYSVMAIVGFEQLRSYVTWLLMITK